MLWEKILGVQRRSFMVPIFKNGNMGQLKAKKLINHTMKPWKRMIKKDWKEQSELDTIVCLCQEKSMTDTIFVMRFLVEKVCRKQETSSTGFVWQEKAYIHIAREGGEAWGNKGWQKPMGDLHKTKKAQQHKIEAQVVKAGVHEELACSCLCLSWIPSPRAFRKMPLLHGIHK